MTHAAKKRLDEFEALIDDIRAEVVAEVVIDWVTAADRLFLELDRREQP